MNQVAINTITGRECPHCIHPADQHDELRPQSALETYSEVLRCVGIYIDALTGEESFCDCIWDTAEE